MVRRATLAGTLSAGMLTTGTMAVQAAELVVFERPGCPYCLAFEREIGGGYPSTAEGRRIPLRRVDLTAPPPGDLAFITVERFVPQFVLVDGRREIGRIRGYAGEARFWALFDGLVDRLPERGAATDPAAASPP